MGEEVLDVADNQAHQTGVWIAIASVSCDLASDASSKGERCRNNSHELSFCACLEVEMCVANVELHIVKLERSITGGLGMSNGHEEGKEADAGNVGNCARIVVCWA